jgi:hypothetical protein
MEAAAHLTPCEVDIINYEKTDGWNSFHAALLFHIILEDYPKIIAYST